jgi:predicted nucleic acid-binding protein
VIPPDRLILLDTNVLLHLIRGRAAGRWIDERYRLRERSEKPLVSVVSVGELFRIAHRREWGTGRLSALNDLVAEMLVIGLEPEVVRGYGEWVPTWTERGRPFRRTTSGSPPRRRASGRCC